MPVNQRGDPRRYTRGYLPIVDYKVKQSGVLYNFRAFAAPYNLDPREELVGFVRVTISNPGKSRAHATLDAAYNPRGGTGPLGHALPPVVSSEVHGPARIRGASRFRGDFQRRPRTKTATPRLPFRRAPPADNRSAGDLHPSTLRQESRGRSISRFRSFRSNGPRMRSSARLRGIELRAGLFENGTVLAHPACRRDSDRPAGLEKVVDTMRSSLIYDLMARDIEADGKHFTQTVNKFQYHGFFARDTSFIARSYELMNLPEVARGTVERYLVRDKSGRVKKFFHDMPDDWGQSLWALGAYYTSTGDRAFARDVAPAIPLPLGRFRRPDTSKDPLGLWPVAGPYDNELINGHYTSHNLWALLGLRNAEILCKAAGDFTTAQRAHDLYARFFKGFLCPSGGLDREG